MELNISWWIKIVSFSYFILVNILVDISHYSSLQDQIKAPDVEITICRKISRLLSCNKLPVMDRCRLHRAASRITDMHTKFSLLNRYVQFPSLLTLMIQLLSI